MFIRDVLGSWESDWEKRNPEPDGKDVYHHVQWLDRRFKAYCMYEKTIP